jgi:hypothetical protein
VNIKGVVGFINSNYYNYIVAVSFISLVVFYYSELECANTSVFVFYYDDFYTAVNSQINNDFYGMYVSYYCINILEYLIVGLILLFGSVFCITLYKVCSIISYNKYTPLFKVFNFFGDFINFFFLRKQNLTKQGISKEVVKIYKKF